jgi:hypothetical protein
MTIPGGSRGDIAASPGRTSGAKSRNCLRSGRRGSTCSDGHDVVTGLSDRVFEYLGDLHLDHTQRRTLNQPTND